MVPVLEAVPNFSAGRDRALVERLVEAAAGCGVDVLDASSDPDHNRTVLTLAGGPTEVEDASVELARLAVQAIDLTEHSGVHPRVGALDVLPFVPLLGLSLEDARSSARRVGNRLAEEVGIPVLYYGEASDPPGRELATLRRGGFERFADRFPEDRAADVLPPGWSLPGGHPTAGVTLVGARPLLLAWNIVVEGLSEDEARSLAEPLREQSGGIGGLRVLVRRLPSNGRLQVSMNLEDVKNRKPFMVFREIEDRFRAAGGSVMSTEVVGLVPSGLIFDAAADRLSLLDPDPTRALSSRLAKHVARRVASEASEIAALVRVEGDTPPGIRRAVERMESTLSGLELWNDS